jgi:EmrB/QacA subfamily drug resistance transporter
MGMYGLGVVVAPAIGPTLGGWLVEHTTWPAIFLINLPVGLLGALASTLVLPRMRPTSWPKFDFLGFVTIAYGLFAILLASSEGPDWGWTGYPVLILFISGALSLALFVVIELEVDTPLLDVRVFSCWIFTNSLVLVTVVSVGLNAVLFYLPLFMQDGQGITALNSGITLLPEALALAVIMPIAGKLYDLFGARWLIVIGLAISAYGTYLLVDLSPATTRMDIMVWTSLRSIGVGLAMMPIMTAGLTSLPPESTGAGSAWSTVGQRVAGSLGLAGFGAMITAQQSQLMSDRGALLSSGNTASVPGLQNLVDQGTTGLYGLYQQLQAQILATTYANVFLVATVLTAAVILLALMMPTGRPQAMQQPPPQPEVDSAERAEPTTDQSAQPSPAPHPAGGKSATTTPEVGGEPATTPEPAAIPEPATSPEGVRQTARAGDTGAHKVPQP